MAMNSDPEGALAYRAAILDLLRSRRTVFDFEPETVPQDILVELLDVARFAPNHKLTEPWRFTVIGPETKRGLAHAWAEFQVGKLGDEADADRRAQVRAAGRAKILGKPTIVVVRQRVADDDFRVEEDYAAMAAAIQNIQLAAWAHGIGCQWSTNGATRDPAVLAHAAVEKGERGIGFLFLGYPSAVPDTRRMPLEEVVTFTP